MILKNCPVIVEECKVRARVNVKIVCCASVIKIVDHGCDQRRENLQVGYPIL